MLYPKVMSKFKSA